MVGPVKAGEAPVPVLVGGVDVEPAPETADEVE